MGVTVRIPTPLRRLTAGADQVELEVSDLSQMIDRLEANYPGVKERLLDDDGELRYFVNIYVNGEDIRFDQGLNTAIKSGDEISIVPAVAGGADSDDSGSNSDDHGGGV